MLPAHRIRRIPIVSIYSHLLKASMRASLGSPFRDPSSHLQHENSFCFMRPHASFSAWTFRVRYQESISSHGGRREKKNTTLLSGEKALSPRSFGLETPLKRPLLPGMGWGLS